MTPDVTQGLSASEIRQLLKPKHNWFAIIGTIVAVLTAAAALARWAFTAPTQTDFQSHDSRIRTVETDHAVLKANVDGMRNDFGDLKGDVREIKIDIRQLVEAQARRR